MPTSDGWPGRAGRLNYGPTMRDERRTVDPDVEINAENIELSEWQAGGIGLCAPKAVLSFSPALLVHGAFAWDQTVYRNVVAPGGLPSYLTITGDGTTGDPYVVTFATQVAGRPDVNGEATLNALGFDNARAQVVGDQDPLGSSAEVNKISANIFEVRMYVGLPRGSTSNLPFCMELF